MNDDSRTTLKVIAALATGFVVNAGMTLVSAPGHTGTALAAGLLLTAFGFAFAKHAMEIVMLPVAVVAFIFRGLKGAKAKPKSTRGGDRIDAWGRALFVASYSLISGMFGLFVGTIDGGMGWFMSFVMFGALGLLLAALVPNTLIWGAEGGDATGATPTEASKADQAQALREGVPAVVLADKVAKSLAKAMTESAGTDPKR